MDEIIAMLNELHPEIEDDCEGLVEGGVLTSIDIVTLISEISDTFDVTVPASMITPENFASAEAIWEMVSRLMDE